MRPFTVKTEIVAADKASKNINIINKAASRLSKNVIKESKVAGSAFSRFTTNVVMGIKRAKVSLNSFNAKINTIGRNIKRTLGTLGLAVGFAAITMAAGNTINKFAKFEQANASLSSVLSSATGPDLKALQIDSKRLGATTAKTATEIVGLQESFGRLGFASDDIINMTQSTIAGSIAMKGALADTADLAGAVIKTFDKFDSIHASEIIDKLTLSTQKSALNFSKLEISLPKVGGAANALKVPFTKTLALLGKLSDSGIDASTSGTALRKIFITSTARGTTYQALLQKVANSTDQLKIANELFGKTAAVQAVILAKNISKVNELDIALQNAAGTAETAAAKQLDTLTGSITILGSAWEGYILNIEDGTGALGTFLKDVIRTTTEILSLATGTAKATDKMTDAELRIRSFAETAIKLLKILKAVVITFVAFKTVMLAITIATKAAAIAQSIWNTYQAVSLALQGKTLLFLQGNTAATLLYSAATKIMTAATWLYTTSLTGVIAATWAFTAALLANPITWIVLGIAALIAGIVLLVKHWDKVKSAIVSTWNVIEKSPILKILLWPIWSTIKVVQLLIQNFDLIKQSIVNFFKAAAQNTIVKFLLWPIFAIIAAVKFLIKNFDTIKTVVGGVFKSIKGLGSSIFAWFGAIGNYISAVFQVAYNKIVTNFIKPFVSSIKAAFNFVVEKISKIATKVKTFAIKLIQPFMPVIEFFKGLGETLKTSIIDKFKQVGKFVSKIIDKISLFFKKSTAKINAKTEQIIKIEAGDKTSSNEIKKVSETNESKIDRTNEKITEQEITTTKQSDKMAAALDKNTKAVKDSSIDYGKWKGRFITTIVKDANVKEKNVTSELAKTTVRNEENIINTQKNVTSELAKTTVNKQSETFIDSITKMESITISNETLKESEIAKSTIKNEENIINSQKDVFKENDIIRNISNVSNIDRESNIIKQKSVTNTDNVASQNNRRNDNKKDEIKIILIDKTGDKFGVEIESTGVTVTTTGNE